MVGYYVKVLENAVSVGKVIKNGRKICGRKSCEISGKRYDKKLTLEGIVEKILRTFRELFGKISIKSSENFMYVSNTAISSICKTRTIVQREFWSVELDRS